MRTLAQGQAIRDLRQGGQVKLVGFDRSAVHRRLGCLACGGWGNRGFTQNGLAGIVDAHIATWPAQPVLGFKLQALREELKPIGQQAAAQTALHRLQSQGLQGLGQPDIHIGQGHVGRGGGDAALAHVSPGAQAALALRHLQLGVHIAVQHGHVHTFKRGVNLSIPFLPIAIRA